MGQLKGIARRGARRAPMEEVDAATISVESGISGDHKGQVTSRQVTVLAAEDWQAACTDVGTDLPWITRRANLLVDGLDLPQTAGVQIKIGGCVLEITGETDPCERMDEQHDGLRRALTPDWRGGRTCRVVTGGDIRIGDTAEIIGV